MGAEANRMQPSYLREVDWGTTPSSPFQEFPYTGGGFPHGSEEVRSQTIRDDAQLGDSKRVGLSPAANYDFEFAANTYDEFIRNVIRSDADWTADLAISAADISFDNAGQTIDSVAGDFGSVAIGQLVKAAGSSEAANNQWWRVTAASAYQLTLTGGTVADDVAGDTITVNGSQLLNGSTLSSVSLQQNYVDQTTLWHIMTGCRCNAFSLAQTEGGIITGSVAFDGKQRAQAAAGGGDTTTIAAPSKDVVTEVDGFETVWIDDTAITTDVFALSLAVATATRPRKALGSLPRTAMGLNSPNITGAIEMYLEDATWTYDATYQDFTAFSLMFSLDMQGGDYYIFQLPQCHFTEEPATNPGLDNDLMLSFSFDSEPGSAYGAASDEKMIQVCRVLA